MVVTYIQFEKWIYEKWDTKLSAIHKHNHCKERNITSYAHCLPDKNKLFIVLQEIYHYPLQEGCENMAKKNTNHLPQYGATQINMSNKPQTQGEEQ